MIASSQFIMLKIYLSIIKTPEKKKNSKDGKILSTEGNRIKSFVNSTDEFDPYHYPS